jgi:NADPH-dependent 2,4-dienoyl-CoA reductase/sulfur reductase-like enzyme/rhodanese-related sulfurtransferase
MAQHRIVIVGGALAGPTAAARAREVDEHAHILLLERAPNVSYAIGGLAYHLSGEVKDLAALDQERAAFFRANYDVEVRTGVEVHAIDARARTVATDGGVFEWDALVVSTGAESISPDVPGLAGALNVVPFRNLVHLKTIVRELARGKRAVVIGGGHFGAEAADGLARRGADVVLLEQGPHILSAFAKGASNTARRGLEALGVDVRTGTTIASVTRKGARVSAIVTTTGATIPCDVVVVAAGVRPRTGLLARAGARLIPNGAVRIDEHCETSLPDVFACGSCVAVRHAVSDDVTWLPQASIVDKTAQVAGACAAGRDAELAPVLGTMIVRAGRAVVARTGLAQADLTRAEIARVHPLSRDGFFPGAAPIAIELAYDPRTGRVLAADAWGTDGVDKRIDVLATAIAGALTVADVASLDLAYEPAFSTSRDAVNVAGAVALETAHERGLVWSADDVAAREGITLVDVRSVSERALGGGIAGARKSSIADVRAGVAELAQSPGPIVFVSGDGRAGFLAAQLARARGVHDAGFLSGGLRSWIASGLPVETAVAKTKSAKTKSAKSEPRRRK